MVQNDENTLGYFVCDRYRGFLTYNYCKNFNIRILHKTYKSAYMEMIKGFYDDSDYAVIKMLINGDIELIR